MPYDPEDKDTKAALKAAVTAAIEEATAGLIEKNNDLITRLKKAQKDSTISPEDHAALQAELDEAKTKLAVSVKALKTAATETDKHKTAHESSAKTVYELLVDNGLSAALLAVGVKNPAYQKAAKALLSKETFTFEGEGAARVAKVGDKSLAEFVKTWATGDEGKAFVDAPGNKGGGAPGGDGKLDADALSKITDPSARLAAINTQGATA